MNLMKNFREYLGKELLFFDGGMGTMLQKRGLAPGGRPELWNIEKPEEIEAVQKSYVEAGADIIKTNTFGANSIKFNGDGELLERIIVKGVEIARRANPDGFVALDIGPLGKLLKPMGELSFEEAYEIFSEVVKIGAKTDCDLILIETMTDVYEAKAAVLAAKENSTLPIVTTFAFEANQRLLTGATIETTALIFEGLGVDAIGFNCGLGPREMKPLVEKLLGLTALPVVVNPNAGLPECVDGVTTFNVAASEFAGIQKEIIELGCALAGGCCGTTPDHIKAVYDMMKGTKVKERANKAITKASSATKTAVFAKRPLVVGERINPTGNEALTNAIKDGDIDTVIDEVFNQTSYGVDILDVNVAVPGTDEPEIMEKVIYEIQSICNVPLQIDTANAEAMERALRIYNGKAIINSVNGTKESMDKVFPIAKKYGAAVVCMTFDEKGVENTFDDKINIAKKIIKEAEKYGIKGENLIFDTLTLPEYLGEENKKATLDALCYIKNELGYNTMLGVSNISHGAQNRDDINVPFFTEALKRGLSAGIINPMSDEMMDAYHEYLEEKGIESEF